jgi:hypothetical protein
MKHRISWFKITVGGLVIVAVLTLAVILPYYPNLFSEKLAGEVHMSITVPVDFEQNSIGIFVKDFFIIFTTMMITVGILNIVFLIMEESITKWFRGSWLRIFAQLALNFLCFIVFLCIVIYMLPRMAMQGDLSLDKDAYSTMLLCMSIGFFVLLAASMLGASPRNRGGLLWPKRKAIKDGGQQA